LKKRETSALVTKEVQIVKAELNINKK